MTGLCFATKLEDCQKIITNFKTNFEINDINSIIFNKKTLFNSLDISGGNTSDHHNQPF